MPKDFSTPKADYHDFTIDEEVFYAIPDVPGGVIEDLSSVAGASTEAEKMRCISVFLDQVLEDDSARRFAERYRSKERPVTFVQALQIFEWLVEVYTDEVRPTPAPSPSPHGPGSTAPSSGPTVPTGEGSTRRVPGLPSS